MLGHEVGVLSAKLFGTLGEDGGGVGFGHGEGYEDVGGAGEDKLDPVEPSPALCVAEEASDLLSVSKIFDTLDYSNESY